VWTIHKTEQIAQFIEMEAKLSTAPNEGQPPEMVCRILAIAASAASGARHHTDALVIADRLDIHRALPRQRADGKFNFWISFDHAKNPLESVAATGPRVKLDTNAPHGNADMNRKPQVLGATGGALGLSALALAFGACCVAPWAVTLLGVSGAVLLARMAFVQPYVVAATLALLGVGFWFVYRRRTDTACNVAQRGRLRWLVWAAAVIVIAIDVASFAIGHSL
jgi:mercuric ion transport protein